MAHEEIIRIQPQTDTAVVFIHGILGTPDHFSPLVPLVPPEWSVVNLLLPGHGGSVKDFSASSMDAWRACVDRTVENLLKTHEKVLIAAHSMGTLFALEQAGKHPDRVKRLFLLGVPLRIRVRRQMFVNALSLYFNRECPDDEILLATKNACSITRDKRIWRYLGWIPRYLELFYRIYRTRKTLEAVSTPGIVFQSRMDEMISLKACRNLSEAKGLQVNILDNSMHYYYAPEDWEAILDSFSEFLKE